MSDPRTQASALSNNYLGLDEAARQYEAYKEANKLAMDTEKYGAIGPADPSFLGAVRESVHRFSNPLPDAGLESTVFTEPIANWLQSDQRGNPDEWGALSPLVKGVSKTAAGLVPETRGDALLATALSALPVMAHFRAYPGAIGLYEPTMSHPPLYQRIRNVGGKAEAKLERGDFGTQAPASAATRGRVSVRDRLTTGQKLKRDVKEQLGETATDIASQSSPYQALSWSKVRAAISNQVPGAANDIAAWARRYYLNEDQ